MTDSWKQRALAEDARRHSLEFVPAFQIVESPPAGRFEVPGPLALGLSEPDSSGTRHLLRPDTEAALGRWQVGAAIMLDMDDSGAPATEVGENVTTELLISGGGQLLVTDERAALVFGLFGAAGLFEGAGLAPGALMFASFAYDWMVDVAYETDVEALGARVWMVGTAGVGWGRVFVAPIVTAWVTEERGDPGSSLPELMEAVIAAAGNYRLRVVPETEVAQVTSAIGGDRVHHGSMETASLGTWTPAA